MQKTLVPLSLSFSTAAFHLRPIACQVRRCACPRAYVRMNRSNRLFAAPQSDESAGAERDLSAAVTPDATTVLACALSARPWLDAEGSSTNRSAPTAVTSPRRTTIHRRRDRIIRDAEGYRRFRPDRVATRAAWASGS